MILLIFVEIFHDFGWFFATRIRMTKMKRIQTDPDPKHCKIKNITYDNCVLEGVNIVTAKSTF